jgi:hypothetical protein
MMFNSEEIRYNHNVTDTSRAVHGTLPPGPSSLTLASEADTDVADGEKASWWVSAFITTRADGQFPIGPMIIHEGKSGLINHINENLSIMW